MSQRGCQAVCPGQLFAAMVPQQGVSGGCNLEKKLSQMEQEMRALHKELCNVKKDRSGGGGGAGRPCCMCGRTDLYGPEDKTDYKAEVEMLNENIRELNDELEDCKANGQDLMEQMDDYRKKYLQAQQFVEEGRRQIDLLERDNMRISEQVNQELQRVKKLFQDKLQELAPLPFILETTQMKCQEAINQKNTLQECIETMKNELNACKAHEKQLYQAVENSKLCQNELQDQNAALLANVKSIEQKFNELRQQMEDAKAGAAGGAAQMEDLMAQLAEMSKLASQLDTVREECARQVQRLKDRHEAQKKMLQDRVFSLEKDLAMNRAAARAAVNDRDEIRTRMQGQINILGEHFEEAQQEIETLRSHVTIMKTSYTNLMDGHGPNDFPQCNCQRNL